MPEQAKILFANEAFYVAIANRDGAAMEALWARSVDVACLHPGWPPISGHEDVVESWRRILENEDQPAINFSHATVQQIDGVAIVLCYENVAEHFLIATNIFVQEGDDWKMIHHQSGGCPPPEKAPAEEPQSRLQ